jgi:hypothetical protein
MKRYIPAIIITIVLAIVVAVIAFFVLIRQVGKNFVHETSSATHSNAAPAESLPNRISFPAHYTGMELDSLLDKFIINHPEYRLPDTIGLPQPVECGCDCPGFIKKVYFDNKPREVYEITFQYGDIKEGIIDVVFMYKNGRWTCSKSAYLDSSQQARIRNRLQNEVLNTLKPVTAAASSPHIR